MVELITHAEYQRFTDTKKELNICQFSLGLKCKDKNALESEISFFKSPQFSAVAPSNFFSTSSTCAKNWRSLKQNNRFVRQSAAFRVYHWAVFVTYLCRSSRSVKPLSFHPSEIWYFLKLQKTNNISTDRTTAGQYLLNFFQNRLFGVSMLFGMKHFYAYIV